MSFESLKRINEYYRQQDEALDACVTAQEAKFSQAYSTQELARTSQIALDLVLQRLIRGDFTGWYGDWKANKETLLHGATSFHLNIENLPNECKHKDVLDQVVSAFTSVGWKAVHWHSFNDNRFMSLKLTPPTKNWVLDIAEVYNKLSH